MSPLYHDRSADAAISAMDVLPTAAQETPHGAVDGYHPSRTLSIRVELARQFRRRRTQFTLAFMVLLPAILALAFRLGSSNTPPGTTSFIDLAQSSAGNFVMVTMFFAASFLLIVVIALYFGDTIASEASWSSLKYLLALPVPRMRLLRQKLVVAAILSALCIAVLAAVAAVIGLGLYGAHPLVTPTGETFTGGGEVWRILLVIGYVAVQLAWVAGLALLMTVSTDVPLGAVGTAVLLSIVSQILDQITALGSFRAVLPTHYSFSWTGALVSPVNWADMTRGAFSSTLYAAVFVVAAFLVFRRKDVTS